MNFPLKDVRGRRVLPPCVFVWELCPAHGVLMEQCGSLLAQSQHPPTDSWIPGGPCLGGCRAQKDFVLLKPGPLHKQIPNPNVWPICSLPSAEASLYFEKHQYPAPQINLCPRVEGRGNSEDRTVANPESDCMNIMPISET